jgi:hypothetical protein
MRYNSAQVKQQEIERRIESLKILEKAMTTNRKLADPELITEGAVLIWNMALPLLTPTYRAALGKSFEAAASLLEMIQSTDHLLRVRLHLELAKIELESGKFIFKADEHISKALTLDPSVPLTRLTQKPEAGEDPALYQRPLERFLKYYREKIRLKMNSEGEKSSLERVIIDL